MTDTEITHDYEVEMLKHNIRKHKLYLDKQVRRHDYLDEKFKNRNDNSYANKSQAFEDALDHLESLFGEKQ
jgi:uncharacterized coiled-coil protein SlyX